MLARGYSWRLSFYVEVALAGLLFILAFLFVEETSYKRGSPDGPKTHDSSEVPKSHTKEEIEEIEEKSYTQEEITAETVIPPRRSFLATLKPWSSINHDERFFLPMARSFTYYLVPSALWVVITYVAIIRKLNGWNTDVPQIWNLHRSRCISLRLHFSHQDRSTSLQLGTGKFPLVTLIPPTK